MTRFIIFLIKLYQKTLSPRTGFFSFIYFSPLVNLNSGVPSGCKQNPTCSEYGIESISKYGVRKGIGLTVKRIIKCK